MALTRIWNISDDPSNSAVPTTVTVLGKALAPGRSLQVDEAILAKAHKIKSEVALGILAIGKAPPKEYTKHRRPARATLASGVSRTHGKMMVQEVEKAVAMVAHSAPMETPTYAPPEMTVVEETPEETSGSDDSSSSYSRRRRGK